MMKLMIVIMNIGTLKDLGNVSILVNIAGRRNDWLLNNTVRSESLCALELRCIVIADARLMN